MEQIGLEPSQTEDASFAGHSLTLLYYSSGFCWVFDIAFCVRVAEAT